MSTMRARLEQKLAQNNQRHQQASQQGEFDAGRQHVRLPLAQIRTNPFQPRRQFDDAELHSLAQSIEENGLLQPISVRRAGPGEYELVAGERRLRAHQQLGKTTIEALVITATDDELVVLALAENISRADLSDFEIGRALRRIEHQFPSRTRLAEALGLNREDMYRYFAFDALPAEVQARLEQFPRLLSRAAASEIKKVLGAKPGKAMLKKLQEALDLLQAGQLDQGKVARFIQAATPGGRASVQQVLTNAQGRPAGSWSTDERAVRIALKRQQLSDDQVARLQQFIEGLLQEPLSPA